MSTSITVRDIDPAGKSWLKRSRHVGVSMEEFVRRMIHEKREKTGPAKVGLLIAGLEVDHLHIHVSPIDNLHDMDFARGGPNPGDLPLATEASRIRAALFRDDTPGKHTRGPDD